MPEPVSDSQPAPEQVPGGRLAAGDVMWSPDAQHLQDALLTEFARDVERRYGLDFGLDRAPAEGGFDYAALWRWSVENYRDFWEEVWRFFAVAPDEHFDTVLQDGTMPGHGWFLGARLNYARSILAMGEGREDEPALIAVGEDDRVREITWAELRASVAGVANALRARGVVAGDRVVAYLPNVPEAIIAFLATASLGAVWSVCGPEVGATSALSRFAGSSDLGV